VYLRVCIYRVYLSGWYTQDVLGGYHGGYVLPGYGGRFIPPSKVHGEATLVVYVPLSPPGICLPGPLVGASPALWLAVHG